jgi:hypothetical protein
MFKSCAECTNKCCKAGPGPYTKIPVKDWLYNNQGSDKYNKACEHFNLSTELCTVWGTLSHPWQCKVYMCSFKEYSALDLLKIDDIWQKVEGGLASED